MQIPFYVNHFIIYEFLNFKLTLARLYLGVWII